VRLFLFDVDGTLLTAQGAGREAFAQALTAVYGTTGPVEQYDFRGKTDPQIVYDLMTSAGLTRLAISTQLTAFFDAYVTVLGTLVDTIGRVRVMPGVPEVVRRLGAREDAIVGLLTGNIERGARVKLQPTGLLPHFRLGAYGSDAIDRRRLPAVACDRARALAGGEVSFDRVTIIGDTPLDVDCARACGARAVAVATGQYGHAELAACTPDLLFNDFGNIDDVLSALTRA
jgi:phosphoglycolate phosphatase-like HAD superfamily hydrolase